jgi:phage terminase large subunit
MSALRAKTELIMPVAEVFAPLDQPGRYKGAYGGRGSGKSHDAAGRLVRRCRANPGSRGVCIRQVQKDLKQSAKQLIEDKVRAYGLGADFDPRVGHICTPGGGVIIFEGMQDHNAESIKSLEAFDIAWVEEAQTLTAYSLDLLRPTIRKPGSEIWFTWNPRRKTDAVDDFMRTKQPKGAVSVLANWSDNPWFTAELEDERQTDLEHFPERYNHKWEGDYAGVFEGAYFANDLAMARRQDRICRVAQDPLQAIRIFCDLGGSSGNADAFTMWVCQFLGREIRVLDYYETQGQAAATHFRWLKDNGYEGAHVWLPHDGTQQHGPVDTTWEGAFKAAGFKHVVVIGNQGKGAAGQRIEAARRVFPMCWFNETSTEAGRLALGAYHEKKDQQRNIGLGPNHDWASHGADAFGLMAICYDPPKAKAEPEGGRLYTVGSDDAANAWMGA